MSDPSSASPPDEANAMPWYRRLGFFGALALLAVAIFAPPLFGLSEDASKVALLCLAMALLWVTEALPIPATALLPIVMLPLLDVSTVREATAPYADPIIYLFMGGFMLSIAMERWNLHRRVALGIIQTFGVKPRSLMLGFLVASAFISMWVSNSATAMMMLPIAISVHAILKESRGEATGKEFGAALVLAIAYGANIGGMGTLIGTPPNAILKGFMEKNYGIEVSFVAWMKFGVPLVMVALPLVHFILTRISFRVGNEEAPGLREALAGEIRNLGRMRWPEYAVAIAFGLAVIGWISRSAWQAALPMLTDEVIAMTAASILFFVPADFRKGIFILDWKSVKKLPWDVLVLFGGGLSLASAFEKTQLAQAMAGSMQGMGGWPPLLMVFLVVAVMVVATALTSNTATTAAFLPVIGSLALAVGQPPLLLAVPVAVAASADFMLPVGTPPNAVAYGSGLVPLPRMIRAGIWVDLLFVILIPLMMWTIGRWAFGL